MCWYIVCALDVYLNNKKPTANKQIGKSNGEEMFIAHHQFSVRENIFIANGWSCHAAAAAAATIKTEEV